MNAGFINQNELQVLAMQRSGHHAIINWVIRHTGQACVFLNNCRPATNPFASCAPADSLANGVDLDAEARGQLSRKQWLIYNYEDCPLPGFPGQEFEMHREAWIGASQHTFQLLVHRDAFNLLASKLRWAYGSRLRPTFQSIVELVGLWKVYARELLGETAHLPAAIHVNYNRWVSDQAYRRELAQRLGLPFTDAGFQEVAKWGPVTWGDTFDGLEYDGRAHEMQVLQRWRHFVHDDFYRKLFRDRELVELSNRLFGQIPGTEAIVSS